MEVDIFSIFVNILDGIEDGALKEKKSAVDIFRGSDKRSLL